MFPSLQTETWCAQCTMQASTPLQTGYQYMRRIVSEVPGSFVPEVLQQWSAVLVCLICGYAAGTDRGIGRAYPSLKGPEEAAAAWSHLGDLRRLCLQGLPPAAMMPKGFAPS